VKDFLVLRGVKVEQLSAKGFGESKPVASNDTESERAKNRRTEFVIKKL
jgi:outer membrane protein OmpA-like peptidoglycan-associated protein